MSMDERTEFLIWLKDNRVILAGRSPDEVGLLARLAGFDVVVVCQVLSHFKDALQGSSFDNGLKMQMRGEIAEINRQSGKIDLTEQWIALYWKLTHDRDFEQGD